MSVAKDSLLKLASPIIVLDTNTVLSSLLFSKNKLSLLRVLWQSEKIIPLASKATISELIRVLAYPKFKLSSLEQQNLLGEYLPYVKTITKLQKLLNINVCRDINDVMFLELALSGNADCLVTGDKDLLEIQQAFKFKIVTPAEFIFKLQR